MWVYIVVDGVKHIGEGEVFGVISGVVEAEHFGSFGVVHIFGIVVVLVVELFDRIFVVILTGRVDLVEFQHA